VIGARKKGVVVELRGLRGKKWCGRGKSLLFVWLLRRCRNLLVREFQIFGDEPTEIISGELRKVELKEQESRWGQA